MIELIKKLATDQELQAAVVAIVVAVAELIRRVRVALAAGHAAQQAAFWHPDDPVQRKDSAIRVLAAKPVLSRPLTKAGTERAVARALSKYPPPQKES